MSQAPSLSTRAPSEGKKHRGKVRWDSPIPFNSSDDELLSDKGGEPEPKSRRRDHITPELMIVDDDDPLPNKPKGLGKKPQAYSQEELDSLNTLLLHLKSEARTIQYGLETAGLTKYRNIHILGLRGDPNTDDHSTYLSKVKKESWSYPAKGNLIMVRQFFKDLHEYRDPDKIQQREKTLWDKGMPGIPQQNTPKEKSGN